MAAGVGREFIDNHPHQLKQKMGCMPAFFHLFERNHNTTRRLPSSQSARPSWTSENLTALTDNSTAVTSLPVPVSILDFKEGVKSHWKLRETPRLSLDSKAVLDTKGKLHPREIKTKVPSNAEDITDSETQRRSPSVVARLMGIEVLPDNPLQLRRSASESRVVRDPSYYQFLDAPTQHGDMKYNLSEVRVMGEKKVEVKKVFLAEDFFPEPKRSRELYDEIEKKLRMRGIEDLETLKQILDSLQFKGLLHSNPFDSSNGRQLPRHSYKPIVVMGRAVAKPSRPQLVETRHSSGNQVNARRGLAMSSPERRKPWNSGKMPKNPRPQRRGSSISSPRVLPAKSPVDKCLRNPRLIFTQADDDTSATVSESSIEYRSGRRLLERCDKLLHSIAAFTAAEQQPSPVSVLESSLFLGSECSPSPLSKRSLDFNKEGLGEWEDELWSTCGTTVLSTENEDKEYSYVSEIIRLSSGYGKASSSLYYMLEKRRKSLDDSKTARLCRRLVFDTVTEILERNLNLSSWESFARANYLSSASAGTQLDQVWSELQRIREEVVADDLNGITSGVIKKDMAIDHLNGRIYQAAEMSEAVLNIERLIFKDLIADTIWDLSEIATKTSFRPSFSRRKLEF